MEDEQAFVKGAFHLQILDDETGVKDARADLMRGGSEKAIVRLHEGERMAFGVFESETRRAGFVFGDESGFDFVGEEIFAHLRKVRSGESDFGKEIVGRSAGDLLQFDALAAIDCVAGIGNAEAGGSGGAKAENFGVEGAGGVEVGGIDSDGRDAGDFGARERLRLDVRDLLNAKDRESTEKRREKEKNRTFEPERCGT